MIKRLDLATERLRIRHFEERDLASCIQFHQQVFDSQSEQSEIESWLRWTIDSYRELANLSQPPYADYAVELKDSGEFVGAAGIVPTVVPWGALTGNLADNLLSPEVGLFWGIMPAYRRRGYASEAAEALVAFIFDTLKLRQVVATTERENVASQKTMKKLGMALYTNPHSEPAWCQVVGKVENPRADLIQRSSQYCRVSQTVTLLCRRRAVDTHGNAIATLRL